MTTPTDPVTNLTDLLDVSGDGVHWSLDSEDVNANLVHLDPGHHIDDHVNDEVEVLVVVLSGFGTISIEGHAHPLAPTTVALVPRSSRRQVTASKHGMTYLSIHRRRGGIAIGRPPARGE